MHYCKVLWKLDTLNWGIRYVQHKICWCAKIMRCTQWVMNPVLSSSHWYPCLGTRIPIALSFLVMACREAASASAQALSGTCTSQGDDTDVQIFPPDTWLNSHRLLQDVDNHLYICLVLTLKGHIVSKS